MSAKRMDFARMQLHGRLANVQERETKDGTPFVQYGLAVNRFAPKEAEEGKKYVTDWYNVSVFDPKQLNFFRSQPKNGTPLFVEADITQRLLADEEGQTRIVTSLKQTNFDLVRSSRKEGAESDEHAE